MLDEEGWGALPSISVCQLELPNSDFKVGTHALVCRNVSDGWGRRPYLYTISFLLFNCRKMVSVSPCYGMSNHDGN